jgi:hypothetical protein
MPQDGKLKLSLVDVYGQRLQEGVDISMRNLQLMSDPPPLRGVDASKIIIIKNLSAPSNNVYQVRIDPPSYHPTNRFVSIGGGNNPTEEEFVFAIDITKVVKVTFPPFNTAMRELRDLLNRSSVIVGDKLLNGEALYDGLDDIPKACVMNIARKTQATVLPNGKGVIDLIRELKELRPDRFFATVERELREETINATHTGLFHPVLEILHQLPPQFADFVHAGSFKTDDQYGNLQLTFFRRGDEIVADIDIDDASGLGHIFQVLRNDLTGEPTHPYNIHQILLQHQHLNPRYVLHVRDDD